MSLGRLRGIPPNETEEAKAIIAEYPAASREKLEEWAERYNYASIDSFMSAILKRYGVKRVTCQAPISSEEKPPVVNVPEIKIHKYKAPRKRKMGDPETQVLLLGDGHAGEITPSYSPDIYKQRMAKIFENTLTITELHRNMYPINDLVIFMLGDMVHGENPYQGAKIGTVDRGATEQVYDLAFPELLSLLSSFRENFRTVNAYCVWGNHGKISREAPRTSNWDNMLYNALDKAKKPDGINIYPPKDFCQLVTVNGFRFFAYHGDQINMSNGIPYFAQIRKLMSWHFNYKGFAYAVQGHFHKDDLIRATRTTKGFINGALVTDDPFALEKIGTSGIPCQWTFGVHEHRGLTWSYSLIVDDAYLPEPSKIEEVK